MDALIIKRQFILMQTLVKRAIIFRQKKEVKDASISNANTNKKPAENEVF
jgi:hypothetical protein